MTTDTILFDCPDIPLCNEYDSADSDVPKYDPLWVRTLWQAYKALEAQNAELRQQLQAARQWQPVELDCKACDKLDETLEIYIKSGGACFMLSAREHDDSFIVELPDDIRLCRKVTP